MHMPMHTHMNSHEIYTYTCTCMHTWFEAAHIFPFAYDTITWLITAISIHLYVHKHTF